MIPAYNRIMWRIIKPANLVVRRWRRRAVQHLQLKPGDCVIDAGCGSGSNFTFLVDAVGPNGRVLGIEIDPFMTAKARELVLVKGWKNVSVITASAQDAVLENQYDALLMFAVQEILNSEQALNALFTGLRDKARVVTFGAKLSDTFPGRLANPLFRRLSRTWLPPEAPIGARPWEHLEARLDDLKVEIQAGGIFYLVHGTKRAKPIM